jgi:hypothetical protein
LKLRPLAIVGAVALAVWLAVVAAAAFGGPAVRVPAGYAYGTLLLRTGDYNGAVVVLGETYRMAVGDPAILAAFKRAQELQASATNKKAHLQHGHEGPGGVLRPDQIER